MNGELLTAFSLLSTTSKFFLLFWVVCIFIFSYYKAAGRLSAFTLKWIIIGLVIYVVIDKNWDGPVPKLSFWVD